MSEHRVVATFLTPQRTAPLGLDMESFGGGGWAPAQFEGRTIDGRAVYARYRGGGLSVHVADAPGEDALSGEKVLDATIGLFPHGGISLGHLCRVAGITVKGALPPLPNAAEMAREDWHDHGGGTTFFAARTPWLTPASMRMLIGRLAAPDDIHLVETLYGGAGDVIRVTSAERLESFASVLLHGAPPAQTALASVSRAMPVEVIFSDRLMVKARHVLMKGGDRRVQVVRPEALEALGDPAPTVAAQDPDCPCDGLNLWASFDTGDAQARSRIEAMVDVLKSAFVETRLVATDVATGVRVPEEDRAQQVDPALIAWAKERPERFLWMQGPRQDGPERYLGWRPG